MGELKAAIDAYEVKKRERVPADKLALMGRCTDDLRSTGIEDRALKSGDVMPDFGLPNQHGEQRRLSEYLAVSPLVLNIYRGGWCPYCSLEMKALHDVLGQIESAGYRLVGMSPEMPEQAEATTDKAGIDIDILHDAGNRVSEQLGLMFTVQPELKVLYQQFGINLDSHNGDGSWTLPVPATYVIGRDGVIRHAFVNADYTQRLEPADILRQLG